MALPATLVWEIRPTNGTADAGGGFDPSVAAAGTDYSQQDAVQAAYTDLVLATTTTLSSVIRPFIAADVGNNLCITGGVGFTAEIFNIRSVAAGVATIDRVGGTLASTGGTANLGGARNGFNTGTKTLSSSLIGLNKVWVKAEAWNEAVTLATTAGAVFIEAYTAMRGDDGIATNDRAGGAGAVFTVTAASYFFKGIVAKSGAGAGFSLNGTTVCLLYCRSTANGAAGVVRTGGSPALMADQCIFDSNTTLGLDLTSMGDSDITNSVIQGNTTGGIVATTGALRLTNSFIVNNTGPGAAMTSGKYIFLRNTIANNTGATADGVLVTTPNINQIFLSNIFAANGRDGVRATSGTFVADYNNFFGNAGSARTNFPTGDHDLALDPQFVSAAGGNFAIGNASLIVTFPLPGATTTSYPAIGAQRPQNATSGGGSGAGMYHRGR